MSLTAADAVPGAAPATCTCPSLQAAPELIVMLPHRWFCPEGRPLGARLDHEDRGSTTPADAAAAERYRALATGDYDDGERTA